MDTEIIKAVLSNGGAFALLTFIVVAFVYRIAPNFTQAFHDALKEQREDFKAELAAERAAREKWASQIDATLVKLSDRIDEITKRVA